jgi:hypothetical protein
VGIVKTQAQVLAGIGRPGFRKRKIRVEQADDALRCARCDQGRDLRERANEDRHASSDTERCLERIKRS